MSKKAKVLFVDDEERILRSLVMLFRSEYDVRATMDVHEALKIIQDEHIHVIVSDQRMPVMRGAELLRRVREISPNTMRLLLTGYSELDSIVSSVNEGEIFRYISKPWSTQDIRATVSKAAAIALGLPESSTPLAAETADSSAPSNALQILVIDEDPQTAQTVQEVMGENYLVRWGATMDEAFDIIEKEGTAIVISEIKLGKLDASPALKLLKQMHPGILTLVTTSFQDTGTIIGLINEGQIYRFLPKPLRKGLLSLSLHSAVRHYQTLKQSPQLLNRHVVEQSAQTEAGVSGRILSYLSRIRGRNVATRPSL